MPQNAVAAHDPPTADGTMATKIKNIVQAKYDKNESLSSDQRVTSATSRERCNFPTCQAAAAKSPLTSGSGKNVSTSSLTSTPLNVRYSNNPSVASSSEFAPKKNPRLIANATMEMMPFSKLVAGDPLARSMWSGSRQAMMSGGRLNSDTKILYTSDADAPVHHAKPIKALTTNHTGHHIESPLKAYFMFSNVDILVLSVSL